MKLTIAFAPLHVYVHIQNETQTATDAAKIAEIQKSVAEKTNDLQTAIDTARKEEPNG